MNIDIYIYIYCIYIELSDELIHCLTIIVYTYTVPKQNARNGRAATLANLQEGDFLCRAASATLQPAAAADGSAAPHKRFTAAVFQNEIKISINSSIPH